MKRMKKKMSKSNKNHNEKIFKTKQNDKKLKQEPPPTKIINLLYTDSDKISRDLANNRSTDADG